MNLLQRRGRRDTGFSGAIGRAMVDGIEEALWLDAWASAMDEMGERLPRNITRETADRAPRMAGALARHYASILVKLNGASLSQIYARASRAEGKDIDAHELGYYLTMQGLGHGVGWTDDHEPFNVVIPWTEVRATRVGGRWNLAGYVSEKAAAKIKAARAPTPLRQRAEDIERQARTLSYEAQRVEGTTRLAELNRFTLLRRAADAYEVASDAWEEAGDSDDEAEQARTRARSLRLDASLLSRRDPSMRRRAR